MRLPDGVRRFFHLRMVRPEIAREVEDELAFHFEEAVRDGVGRGLSEAEARRMAQAAFGNERAYRRTLEQLASGTTRKEERSERADALLSSLAFAFRAVRREPAFTASVVLILACGIGANAVMFSIVDRILLRPPQHLVEPDELRLVHVRREALTGGTEITPDISYPDFGDLSAVSAFGGVAAYGDPLDMTVGRGITATEARAVGVSVNLFSLLGVAPALGAFLRDGGEPLEPNPTIVLAYEYWERQYGRAPDVVDQSVELDGRSFQIVGVAPAGFTGAALDPVDIWIPISESASANNLRNRRYGFVHAVARVVPTATVERAEAEATVAHRNGRADEVAASRYDPEAEVVLASIIAARGPNPPSEARIVQWLTGVSLVVLLIACLNVSNLLLVRAMQKRREIAVRLSLGAGRGRLMSELIVESVTLAVMGAVAASLLAGALAGTVHRILLPNVAFTDASLGGRLLGFTLLASLGAGIFTGLIAATEASKVQLVDTLKDGGHGVTRSTSRARAALLIGQVGLSVVLLVGAGLFVRSLRTAQTLDLGFDSRGINYVLLEFDAGVETPDRRSIYDAAGERIRRLPGVEHVGRDFTGMFGPQLSLGVWVLGGDTLFSRDPRGPFANRVTSGYFEAMDLRILRGRAFGPVDDVDGAHPVVIVTESMASALWPDGDPLGTSLCIEGPSGQRDSTIIPCGEVVGVVENHNRQRLVEDEPHYMYFLNEANRAFGARTPPGRMIVRTTAEAPASLELIRSEAAAVSTRIRFVHAQPMSDFIAGETRSWRLGASMFTAFGFLALLVATWGLVSVLAFDVTLRRQELAIRSALGAHAARLVRLVLRRALLLVGGGVAVGLFVARVTSGFLEPLLFRVSPTDAVTYVVVAVSLLVVGVVAGALPAWRGARVDPREALQTN